MNFIGMFYLHERRNVLFVMSLQKLIRPLWLGHSFFAIKESKQNGKHYFVHVFIAAL